MTAYNIGKGGCKINEETAMTSERRKFRLTNAFQFNAANADSENLDNKWSKRLFYKDDLFGLPIT